MRAVSATNRLMHRILNICSMANSNSYMTRVIKTLQLTAVGTAISVLAPNSLLSQAEGKADSVAVPRDSAAIVLALHEAQAQFEILRQGKIPDTFYRSGAGCPESIGRFCHWNDGDDDWDPPVEHEDITSARIAFLEQLDVLGDSAAGDPWVVGMKVHYLIEKGDLDRALETAGGCTSDRWWCDALEGYSLHTLGRFEEADAVFQESLTNMVYSQRCEWHDISQLLENDLRGDYDQIRCSQRTDMHAAVWDLADPMYIVPGNDRFTEHMSRLVIIELMKDAVTPYGIEWQPDLSEITVRFGWPVAWEKSKLMSFNDAISSRGRPYSRSFFPPSQILMQEEDAAWQLELERAPSLYLPSYLNKIVDLQHQIGMFRRGDSALVAAAYSFREVLSDNAELEAALTVMHPGESNLQTYLPGAGLEDSFVAVGTDSTMIVSLEIYSAIDSVAGRARYPKLRPTIQPGGIGISDILVFEPREPLPESVEEAIFLAHPDTRFAGDTPLGLYWEVYGVAEGSSSVATDVSVIREGRGFFRGLFESVGIARPEKAEVRYQWSNATGETTAVFPRSIVVNLNDADPGNYIVRVTATPDNGEPVVSERRIEIIADE